MQRALITGGAGFVGSHLAERLLDEGVSVTVIDNLSTGSVANLSQLDGHPDFRLVVGNVEEESTMEVLISEHDYVLHLAAAVGVKLIVSEPVRSMITNIRGTEVVLELANKWRKPVLLASTSEVYGKNRELPFKENGDMVLGSTVNSRWSYACSKAIDEFLALAYNRQTQLPVVVARLFNTVGPRQSAQYGMVLPTFVRQALGGEPITVFGDGHQTRTFHDVSDTVEALWRLVNEPAAVGEVFNIGGDEEVSINELAERVKRRTGADSPIVHVPYEEAYAPGFEDMRRRVPDITKIGTVTGFKPTLGLDEIIDRVIEYERGND